MVDLLNAPGLGKFKAKILPRPLIILYRHVFFILFLS